MNNLTNEDIRAFAKMSLTELVTLARSYYMDGNDEEVVVCFNHLSKRLELEEKYIRALGYAIADAHLSATISDYSSSAVSLSQIANLLNAQDDATDGCTLPAYYTSVMSLKHLMGLQYLSFEDSVPPVVSEDNLERFLLYKKINLEYVSQNVDYSFSIHSILSRFVLDGCDVCIRHIYHNFKHSLLCFDTIIKASKRISGLLESNTILLNAAIIHIRLLIMRYHDSNEFIKNARMISVKHLNRDLKSSYNIAVCTHACMHYSSRLFWRGFLKDNISFPSVGETVPLSTILLQLNYVTEDNPLRISICRKIEGIFADLVSCLQISNCSTVVRDSTILEFIELLSKYPLFTHSFIPLIEGKLKILDDDVAIEAQETFSTALKRYDYFNDNIVRIENKLLIEFSETINVIDADTINENITLMPGLIVFSTSHPGVIVIIYNFLQSMNALKENSYSPVKQEASETYSMGQLDSILSYIDAIKVLLSTSIDGTFFDKSLFYIAWFLLKDYDANIEERIVQSMPLKLALALLEAVVLAGQYVFVTLQELEGTSATEILHTICEKVVHETNDNNDLLSLSITTHKVLFSVILNVIDSGSFQMDIERIFGIVSATYMLICDVLSYKEPIANYGRFIRAVLHAFYTMPNISTTINNGTRLQKELMDLLQSIYNIATLLCLDVRFEQILSRENGSNFSTDISFSQIQTLLMKFTNDYGLSCSLLSTHQLFSYRQEFELDKWMVQHRIVTQPRPHRTREAFLDSHPYIQSKIRKIDTNSAYVGANSIFKSKVQTCTPYKEERSKTPDTHDDQEPASYQTEDYSEQSKEDISIGSSVDKVIEPEIKINTAHHATDLFAAPKEEQHMYLILTDIQSNHGLHPRDLVTMSTLPGERSIALDSSRLIKYVNNSNLFAFMCYLLKQILSAEDVTASMATADIQIHEVVRLFLDNVETSNTHVHELLHFLFRRRSTLHIDLIGTASYAFFTVCAQLVINLPQNKDLRQGLLAESINLSMKNSMLPLSFLFAFLAGIGSLCKKSDISILHCKDMQDNVDIYNGQSHLVCNWPESSTLNVLDLSGTDFRNVTFYSVKFHLTIEKLYLNAATFSFGLFSTLIACSINVTEIYMKNISLDCFKIASRINYEDICGLKMIEVSCVERERCRPYCHVFETFKSFGLEVSIVDY